MKSTKQKLREFIGESDIVYLSDTYAERVATSTEIGNKHLDLMALKIERPKIISCLQDELLFVLFFTFLDGLEYNHTLGCATYMHAIKDQYYYLYSRLCVKASQIIRKVCCDEGKYNIPLHFHDSETIINRYGGVFYSLMELFDRFIDNLDEVGEVIKFIETINFKEYDRVTDLKNYDISNFLHCDGGYRKLIVKIESTRTILQKFYQNIKFMSKYAAAGNKFNFMLRNSKKIQNMPYIFRGLIANSASKNKEFMVFEIGKIISDPSCFFSLNYYETFYAIKYYYKILLHKKLISKDEMWFAYDFLILYLQLCKNTQFRTAQIADIDCKMSKIRVYNTRLVNSGKILCFELLLKAYESSKMYKKC